MNAKFLDLNKYPRKDHFLHFVDMENPFISLSVDIDITAFFNETKKAGKPFFLSLLYEIAEVANSIPELRQRIIDNKIIECDECASSFTVSVEDGTYRYCSVYTNLPYDEYVKAAKIKQEEALKTEHLEETIDPLRCFFISCLPWIKFNHLVLPYSNHHFSNPCISIGKYYKENKIKKENDQIDVEERVYIPISIMVNHALVDGYHLGIFFNKLEEKLA